MRRRGAAVARARPLGSAKRPAAPSALAASMRAQRRDRRRDVACPAVRDDLRRRSRRAGIGGSSHTGRRRVELNRVVDPQPAGRPRRSTSSRSSAGHERPPSRRRRPRPAAFSSPPPPSPAASSPMTLTKETPAPRAARLQATSRKFRRAPARVARAQHRDRPFRARWLDVAVDEAVEHHVAGARTARPARRRVARHVPGRVAHRGSRYAGGLSTGAPRRVPSAPRGSARPRVASSPRPSRSDAPSAAAP